MEDPEKDSISRASVTLLFENPPDDPSLPRLWIVIQAFRY